jgi:hypothetical protein
MVITMHRCSSDRPHLEAHLVGTGNESGTAIRNEGGSETSGDILETSATLVDDPSNGV